MRRPAVAALGQHRLAERSHVFVFQTALVVDARHVGHPTTQVAVTVVFHVRSALAVPYDRVVIAGHHRARLAQGPRR